MSKRPPAKRTERPAAQSNWTASLLICAALALITLAVYFPVRHYEFLNYDDPDYVAANPMIQGGLLWENIKWSFTHTYSFNWHPVTWISHMLDCQLFGLNPGAHHLINVAIHIANTLLLFLLCRKMTGVLWPSTFVAAIFALHPLHIESVAWICERKDVLSTFFWLLTTWSYVHYVQLKSRQTKSQRPFYILSLTFFAFGLMSKPMLVTLPFTLLLLDFWPLRRTANSSAENSKLKTQNFSSLLVEKIPFFALALVSSVVTFLVQRSEGAVADTQSFSIGLRIANAFISYLRYLGKTFWPTDLMIFYPYPETWPVGQAMGAAILLLVISGLAIWKARRLPFVFVGWFWFLGTLVPVIGLVQVGIQSMADRYMYVPLIGLSFAVGWGISEIANRISHLTKATWPVVFGVLIAACVALTHQQLRHWRNSITVFEHAIRILPDHVMAHVMAGNAHNDRGNAEKAIYHYNEALKRSPKFAEVHFNLGNLLFHQNKPGEAIAAFEKALQLRPDYIDARANLAVALSSQGKNREALEHEEAALRARPDDPILLRNIAVDLMELKRFDEARERLSRAIEIRPDDPVVYKLLGDVFMAQNKFAEAAVQYQKALQLQPDFADARRRLEFISQRQN